MSKKDHGSLTWKLEKSSNDELRDEDVGPAWYDPLRQGELGVPVAGGRWVTRQEARRTAEEHGLTFYEDDVRTTENGPDEEAAEIDVAEVNKKLREVGVSEADLRLEGRPGRRDVLVWGTLIQSLPDSSRAPDSPYTTTMVSMYPDELVIALDFLVPGWRSTPTS